MGIRAAKPEGVDGGQEPSTVIGQRFKLAHDPELQLREIDVGIRVLEMQIGGNEPVLENKCGLDDAGNAGSRLEMADVRLDGADRTRCIVGAAFAEGGA